jgi:hypothetical protein
MSPYTRKACCLSSLLPLFPDIYPQVWEPDRERSQARIRSIDGFLQINSYDPAKLFRAHAEWNVLSREEFDAIEDHWHSHDGTFKLFNFYSRKVRNEFVAIGNGTTKTFALPAKGVLGATVKLNGVVQAASGYSITASSGIDGCDEITFVVAPANGAVVTFDAADARQLYVVAYVDGKFSDRIREADIGIVTLDFEEAVAA